MKAISAAIVAVAAFVPVPSAELGGDNEGEQWEVKEIRQQDCGHERNDAQGEFTTQQLRQTNASSHYIHR
jgi:hypothetical protein